MPSAYPNPSEKQIVSVIGATGCQGNSVAKSLIGNPRFHVRGITRDPESKASKELAALGVEVVQANAWNREQIADALRGSWAVFIIANSDDAVSFYEKCNCIRANKK